MAVIADKPSGQIDGSGRSWIKRLLFPYSTDGMPRAPVALGLLIIAVVAPLLGFYRWYMETTAFTVGLDYFEPEFQTYWMSWLYGQLAFISIVGAITAAWLWLSRPSREEVMAIFMLFNQKGS